MRHAQARNVIEHIFGVLKRRFRILLIGPEYSMEIQAQIPAALCAIHNFIRIHEPEDQAGLEPGTEGPYYPNAGDNHVYDVGILEENDTQRAVVQRRDAIAEAMWRSYVAVQHERGNPDAWLYDLDM